MNSAVSLALVTAGGLFVRGALNVAVADPGFSLDRELMVTVDASLAGYQEARGRATYRTMIDRLRALPGIERRQHVPRIRLQLRLHPAAGVDQ